MRKTLTAFVGMTALGMQAVAGTNLLQNASFEQAGPGLIPFASWTEAFFGNVFYSADEVPALDGVATAKMFGIFLGPGAQGDTGLIQQVTGVTPGTFYTGTIHTYVSSADPLGAGNFAFLILQFVNSSGTVVGEVVADAASPTTPTGEWREIVASGEAPAGAVAVNFFPLFIQLENNPGAVFWDSASLVVGQPPAEPCNAADLAEPYGVLDLADISAFVTAFTQGCP